MPIDRENKVIFIHVPRCAGTSIIKAVNNEFGKMDHIGHHFWEDYKPVSYTHLTLPTKA